ncbi:MAG: glycosyltransferase family 9 protein, partial [Alphaproteobacteria bacterium]|nr:glycosyltransferase family 9 protein [Alphaproteobacteria bacterium]
MDILFITANRLGDAVLSAGLVDHITRTHPGARLTIVCGSLAAPLFEGVPGRVETIILKKQKYNRHWIDLWKRVRRTQWDMVVDLRNSAVSRLIPARARFIFGRHIDADAHKVAQNAAVMKLNPPPAPRLWVTPEQEAKARLFIPDGGPVLAMGPTANWIGKTWPADRFIDVMTQVTAAQGLLPGARVAVFAAPGEEEAAYKVLHAVPAARQIDVIAKADPGVAAASLARCDLYIGNDSGLMHCAAAAGVPTFGVFGPSWPHIYGPWGTHTAWAS